MFVAGTSCGNPHMCISYEILGRFDIRHVWKMFRGIVVLLDSTQGINTTFCWLTGEENVSIISSVEIYLAVVWHCSVRWPLYPVN